MTDKVTARTWISDRLNAGGMSGRGSVWRARGEDVQWVVHIDELPFGNRLGIDIGLDLQPAPAPRRPTDCPVLLHLENMPFAQEVEVVASLDLDSGLSADSRHRQLEKAADELACYLTGHLTMSAVRHAYSSGQFAAAFIRKDARTALEAGVAP